MHFIPWYRASQKTSCRPSDGRIPEFGIWNSEFPGFGSSYNSEIAPDWHRSSETAPEGRQIVAQGASPGNRNQKDNKPRRGERARSKGTGEMR